MRYIEKYIYIKKVCVLVDVMETSNAFHKDRTLTLKSSFRYVKDEVRTMEKYRYWNVKKLMVILVLVGQSYKKDKLNRWMCG